MINETLINGLNNIQNSVSESYFNYLIFGIYIIGVTLYAIFIWKFHKFVSKRDLLELNLGQYNRYDDSFRKKTIALLLFTLEYIIILPIVVFFWFFVTAVVLLVLAENQNITTVLLISGVIVGSVRLTAYYKTALSQEMAKVFPFNALAVAMISNGFFNVANLLSSISEIPKLLSNTLFYLLAIMALELILRVGSILMPDFNEKEKD